MASTSSMTNQIPLTPPLSLTPESISSDSLPVIYDLALAGPGPKKDVPIPPFKTFAFKYLFYALRDVIDFSLQTPSDVWSTSTMLTFISACHRIHTSKSPIFAESDNEPVSLTTKFESDIHLFWNTFIRNNEKTHVVWWECEGVIAEVFKEITGKPLKTPNMEALAVTKWVWDGWKDKRDGWFENRKPMEQDFVATELWMTYLDYEEPKCNPHSFNCSCDDMLCPCQALFVDLLFSPD